MPSQYAEISAAFTWFFPSMAAVFGALIGSFLNVVIFRVPAGKSIVRPGSHCACGKPIAWFDNIPILSWFILRGRARCCGRPYSFRYPFVELLTAALFLACWLRFAPESPGKAICGMVFISILICATFIDLDHMIIPDVFTIWAGVLGVILSLFVPMLHGQSHEYAVIASVRSATDSLLGLFVGSGLVLWIALLAEEILKKEAMGFGDVKFVGMIGAFCGWQGAVCSIFGGAIVGTIWFIYALIWQKIFPPKKSAEQPVAEKKPTAPAETPEDGSPHAEQESVSLGFGVQVPFGPMLAIGAVIYFLVADRWIAAYFAELNSLL
ncbi:MAG: prepilin peptidase [Verrucomicrobia bacterium]|nr:prepilin peptidase [Verrucomicrobiota bacterium]